MKNDFKNYGMIVLIAILFHLYLYFFIYRNQIFYSFFNNKNDYEQFKNLAFKTINQCILPWEEADDYIKNPNENNYIVFSPSRKFYIKDDIAKVDGKLKIRVYDSNSDQLLLTASHETV